MHNLLDRVHPSFPIMVLPFSMDEMPHPNIAFPFPIHGMSHPNIDFPFPIHGMSHPIIVFPFPIHGMSHPIIVFPFPIHGMPHPIIVFPFPIHGMPHLNIVFPFPIHGMPHPIFVFPFPIHGMPHPLAVFSFPCAGMRNPRAVFSFPFAVFGRRHPLRRRWKMSGIFLSDGPSNPRSARTQKGSVRSLGLHVGQASNHTFVPEHRDLEPGLWEFSRPLECLQTLCLRQTTEFPSKAPNVTPTGELRPRSCERRYGSGFVVRALARFGDPMKRAKARTTSGMIETHQKSAGLPATLWRARLRGGVGDVSGRFLHPFRMPGGR